MAGCRRRAKGDYKHHCYQQCCPYLLPLLLLLSLLLLLYVQDVLVP
jgi:hypothetical protein